MNARSRPGLSYGENVAAVGFGLWMVIGLFIDGWAHDNNKPETFFTPWHGILYSGFAAAAASAVWAVYRRRDASRPWSEAIPGGHAVTLAALGVFGAGAVGDLLWHEVLGIEVGVEALLSPTHLTLLAGGLVALSAPVRLAWRDSEIEQDSLRPFLPVVLALTLMTALVGFFLLYLSPFVNDAAGARFDRAPGQLHEHPSSDVGELQQLLGVASIIVTTVLIAVPVYLVLRRWRPPAGAFTTMFTVLLLLFVGVAEFDHGAVVLAGTAAGITADALARRAPPWLTGGAAIAVLWLGYFALYNLGAGTVAWSAEVWTGSVFLSTLVAIGLSLLVVAQPAPAPSRSPAGTRSG